MMNKGTKHLAIARSKRKKEKIMNVLCFLFVIVLAGLVLFPIWWIFRSSLMSNAELYAYPPSLFPKKWLFSNYVATLDYFKFWIYFGNTMKIIVPSVIAGTATLCEYAFARLRFRGKKLLFTLCIGSMLLPRMVTLIPLYLMWTGRFHLGYTYYPLILPFFVEVELLTFF